MVKYHYELHLDIRRDGSSRRMSKCSSWPLTNCNGHTLLQGQEGITLTSKRVETSRQRKHFHWKSQPDSEEQASNFYGPGRLRGIAVFGRKNTEAPYSFCRILRLYTKTGWRQSSLTACICRKQGVKSHWIPSSNSAHLYTFSNSLWQNNHVANMIVRDQGA